MNWKYNQIWYKIIQKVIVEMLKNGLIKLLAASLVTLKSAIHIDNFWVKIMR